MIWMGKVPAGCSYCFIYSTELPFTNSCVGKVI